MTRFSLESRSRDADPVATLIIPRESIKKAALSVAFRSARNRSALYQRKHADRKAGLYTRHRDSALAALNAPFERHYEWLPSRLGEASGLENSPVIAFAISDLTANLLRPHYDATIPDDQLAFCSDAARRSVYGEAPSARVFHLEDEPIGDVPYTLLMAGESGDSMRFSICHDVRVGRDGVLPPHAARVLGTSLGFWAACPPLLIGGEHKLEAFATLDYDLRHVFGFPKPGGEEQGLYEIYDTFGSWQHWSERIRSRLAQLDSPAEGYHAALGLSDHEVIVVHRIATIPALAEELKSLGAKDAILLDSGGSCSIWANWVNGGRGGILASAWNFRPDRGAVVFLVLHGTRGLPGR